MSISGKTWGTLINERVDRLAVVRCLMRNCLKSGRHFQGSNKMGNIAFRIRGFARRRPRAAFWAMRPASSRAAAMGSSCGTTRETKLHERACARGKYSIGARGQCRTLLAPPAPWLGVPMALELSVTAAAPARGLQRPKRTRARRSRQIPRYQCLNARGAANPGSAQTLPIGRNRPAAAGGDDGANARPGAHPGL